MNTLVASHLDEFALVALSVGFVLRFVEASHTYLNPDEANYFQMSMANEFLELYGRALEIHHPPLNIILMHYVRKISEAELVLRMISIVAGILFPLFVYRWLGRAWSKLAGFIALAILSFAPHLISLSAQARSYTLALLLMSASLYFLDRAIDEKSLVWMTLSAGVLFLATFSEYFVAFFAGSIGIYFLVRIRGQKVPRKLVVAWVITQAGVLALYCFHYLTHVRIIMDHPSTKGTISGWLQGAFLQSGDNMLVYIVRGTAKQFAYLFASVPLGVAMGCFFLFGLVLLWHGLSRDKRKRSRAMIALFVVPFIFVCVGGLLQLHPYSRSRHTIFLAIFIAAGVAVALEYIVRSRMWIVLPAMLFLIPTWHLAAWPDQNNIGKGRHQREIMLTAIEYIRETIPPGSTIFTDHETRRLLDYYLRLKKSQQLPASKLQNDYRIVSLKWSYRKEKKLLEDLVFWREREETSPEEAVWVVDGGFDQITLEPKSDNSLFRVHNLRDFGKVLLILQTPPRYNLTY